MHECLLCKKNMKDSKDLFGKGCVKNIYSFLNLSMPKKVKLREETLYKSIIKFTNISDINKHQKKFLTDRYLTYKYLDKIPYGDYEKVKLQINKDIQNINKVTDEKELISLSKISLKQAYDMYKRTIKFDNNIEKLRKFDFTDEKTLKLLVSSFSFIFNMSRNKNQYENSSFKAMQFVFWQTVIEIGGKYAGFDISADLLQHSLEKEPKDLLITEGKIIEEIKNDKKFHKNVNNIVKQYGKNCDEFYFNSDVDENFPMCFSESDLFFSLHAVGLKIRGVKHQNKWNLDVNLNDRYDYSDPKWVAGYYNSTGNIAKSLFSNTLYNFATCSVKFKVMKEFKIDIQFQINEFEVY